MKKILSAFFIILSVLSFAQEGIKFETSDFKTILAKAKKENKLIFLDAYTTWCGPCKLMAKNIFTLKSVGDHYNANFVNAKIDMEKGEGIDIAKKYDVKVFLLNSCNSKMAKLQYERAKTLKIEFVDELFEADIIPSKRVAALKERFEKGEKDPEFLKNLVNLTAFTEADYAGKVFEKYITAKANTPLAADDMQMLFMTLKNSESPAYKIFKEKKADLLKFMPEKSYEATDKSLKINTVIKKAYNEESKTYDENKFIEGTKDFLTKDEAVKYLNKVKASKALKANDIATYEKLTLETYKDYTNFNSNELNSIAWNFFENVTNKSSLETALKWAQESVKQSENSANTDTLANLYNKLNDKANAKIWAEKAIELAKKNGEDASETQKLLDSLK